MAWDGSLCELPVKDRARIVYSRFEVGDTKLGIKFSLAGLAFHGTFKLLSEKAYQSLCKEGRLSIDAREVCAMKFGGEYRVEHIIPTEIVYQHVLHKFKNGKLSVAHLEHLAQNVLDCAIITKEEDDKLNRLKLRNKMPEGWSGMENDDRLARYVAAGIKLHKWGYDENPIKMVKFSSPAHRRRSTMVTIEEVAANIGCEVEYRAKKGPNSKDQIVVAEDDDYQFLFKYWRSDKWEFCIWAKEGNSIGNRAEIREQWSKALRDWNAEGALSLDFNQKIAGRNKGFRETAFGLVVSFVPQSADLTSNDVASLCECLWAKIANANLMSQESRRGSRKR